MEAKVILCDKCKERVSKRKCGLCELDICEDASCSRNLNLIYKYPIKICIKCHIKLQKDGVLNFQNYFEKDVNLLDDFDWISVHNKIIEHIKPKLFLMNIEGKDE